MDKEFNWEWEQEVKYAVIKTAIGSLSTVSVAVYNKERYDNEVLFTGTLEECTNFINNSI